MRQQTKTRVSKPSRKQKKTKQATRPSLIDLPFRSDAERHSARRQMSGRSTARAQAQSARAVDLPFQSQVLPGATAHRNDCGPACVRMALDFLGLASGVTIDQLADQSDAEDDGTTWDDLVALAQSHGAAATALALPASQLPEPPAILLVRYNGFRRETVEDTRFWDLSAQDASFRHWLWWLGNEVVDGQTVSVWNDPLFAARNGKSVIHSLDELNAAFAPYGPANIRFAVTFAGITDGAPPPDGEPIIVEAFDDGGVNFRSAPGAQDPNTIIKLLPKGQRFTVLESAASARIKLTGGGQNNWLRVRANVDDADREGFVAA